MTIKSLEDISDTDTVIAIDSNFETDGYIEPFWPTEIVKNEPMFRAATPEFAYNNGGSITEAWITELLIGGHLDGIIDTKVCMLMPEFWPCIPGWHHDDVPRELPNGQPDYINPSYRSNHISTIVGDRETSRTEFAIGSCGFPNVDEDDKYYKVWSPMVDEAIAMGFLDTYSQQYGELLCFDDRTWHQGTKAFGKGWRWFGRVTYGSGRKIENEVRRQTQIYLSDPVEGW